MQPGAECGSQNRGSMHFAEEEGEGQAGEEKGKNARLLQVTFIYSKTTEATLTAHRRENSNASNGLVVNNRYMVLLEQPGNLSTWFKHRGDRWKIVMAAQRCLCDVIEYWASFLSLDWISELFSLSGSKIVIKRSRVKSLKACWGMNKRTQDNGFWEISQSQCIKAWDSLSYMNSYTDPS